MTMSLTKKKASTGVCRSIQGSIRRVLYWLPRDQRSCCLSSLLICSGASV